MKTLKSIAAAGLLAAGIVGSASAANTIEYVHIAGAPAIRQDAIAVINHYITANFPAGTAGETVAYNKVKSTITGQIDPSSASYEQWYIENYSSGTDLVISLALTGSTAGVESLGSGTVTQKFIPDDSSTSSLIASPNNSGSITNSEAHVPDFILSDTFQVTTPYNGTKTLLYSSTGSVTGVTPTSFTFATLSDNIEAIEPYVFVGSPGLAARGVTNITTAQARDLFENGSLPLSFFTGNSSDSTTSVYAISRDPGSGSRYIAVAETGVGVTTAIKSYEPSISNAAANPSDPIGNWISGTFSLPISLYPSGVISSTGIYDPLAGDTGYPSFGTADDTGELAAITSTQSGVASPYTGQTAYLVTYLNPSDAYEAVTYGGASQLTYNGVAYSQAALQSGQYTYWSFERVQTSSNTSSVAAGLATALEGAWPAATLSTGVQLSGVTVTRTVDGGNVVQGTP